MGALHVLGDHEAAVPAVDDPVGRSLAEHLEEGLPRVRPERGEIDALADRRVVGDLCDHHPT